jgi:uncharacterized DUF497 family protein
LELQGFEWDDRKAAANLLKHKVSFIEAATVFDDPYVIVEPDLDHSDEELREIATGFSMKDRVLLVVYVEPDDRIRLISARRATPEERRKYESQFE